MRLIKAKVLATGEEIFLCQKENEPDVFTSAFGDKVFKADELEILADTGGGPALGGMPQIPRYEPLDTTAMLKEMMDSVKGHFWRDQRVEIVKILLRRGDLSPDASTGDVVAIADNIIQKLKAYGD